MSGTTGLWALGARQKVWECVEKEAAVNCIFAVNWKI